MSVELSSGGESWSSRGHILTPAPNETNSLSPPKRGEGEKMVRGSSCTSANARIANNALIILIAFTPGLIKILGSTYQNKL